MLSSVHKKILCKHKHIFLHLIFECNLNEIQM